MADIGMPLAKKPRLDYPVDDKRLCTPVTFTAALPRPRMCMLPVKRKAVAHPDLAATISDATTAIPIVRPPLLQNLDDYLSLVGNIYYQAPETGKTTASIALIRRTTLGLLTSPIREPSVIDRWSPYEIALFESAICLVGKQFPQIAKVVGTKGVKDIVEFYYIWKKTKNYAHWKATYRHLYHEVEA